MIGTKPTIIALFVILVFALSFRVAEMHEREISWDAFGYYLYLPATIIQGDPLLKDISWINEANNRYELTETVYQLSANDDGDPVYFFLMGMSWFYLPFFLIAHLLALLFGLSADGFSPIYHYALAIGSISYLLFGFFFLRRILLKYTHEMGAAIVMLVLFFGTNVLEHLVTKNLETVNVLFMLSALVLWNTIQWEENRKSKYLYRLAIATALMVLVKPSEVLILIIPLFWSVSSISSLKLRFETLKSHRNHIFKAALLALFILSPQMIYWQLTTGNLLFDSYVNPGVGLDFMHPHIVEVLFGFRKGWFIYTPLAALMIFGLGHTLVKYKHIGVPIFLYIFFEIWLISSWSEWWYGAAFSCRPIITVYPYLALVLALFIRDLRLKKHHLHLTLSVMILCVAYNLLKWHQFRSYIIDPTRMTRTAFIETFWDLKWEKANEKLLLVRRSFNGNPKMKFKEFYNQKSLPISRADSEILNEFQEILAIPFNDITKSDHAWLGFDITADSEALLVLEISRSSGSYGYQTFEIKKGNNHIKYLTPELRSKSDIVHAYIWNRSKKIIYLKQIQVFAFTRE